MVRWEPWYLWVLTVLFVTAGLPLYAQNDTAKKLSLDSLLLKHHNVFSQMIRNFMIDTAVQQEKDLYRNDQPFQRYKGRIIRKIIIRSLPFGISIGDTTKIFNSKLTQMANALHRNTRNYTIRDNLFFMENEQLAPFVLGDNERHLRDLPFLQDARINVQPVKGSKDSVDVYVLTKDVLSIGGGVRMHNARSISVTVKEDNVMGWGDRIQVQSLYDKERAQPFGYGVEYIKRNILGSFINGHAGFNSFANSLSSNKKEEQMVYLRFIRPLVNPYMRWTYEFKAQQNHTENMFFVDSFYRQFLNYKYNLVDAWAGWNTSVPDVISRNKDERLRLLVGSRILNQHFNEKPLHFQRENFYRYSDVTAVLASVSIFKQNFYKTRYFYGFGRNEDVPEGIDVTLTGGWTNKNNRSRPYIGIDFQRNYFNKSERYFNYMLRLGSYFYKKKTEDVSFLGHMEYFSRLYKLNEKWKMRTYLNASVGKQFNYILDEPLKLESQFGLRGFGGNGIANNDLGGHLRVTLKAESSFFSPWSVLLFRFAPFVFVNTSLFQYNEMDNSTNTDLFSAFGGGLRTRNESLIFGTVELRGFYFPRKTFAGDRYRVELNTNVRFKFNRELIKRPDFIQMN